jgi:hypothetical protein
MLILGGKGASVAPLGTSEATTLHILQRTLDAPSLHSEAAPGLQNCGVDATATWHALIAYFNHNQLVGLSLGPGKNPTARTSLGLVLGDTLNRARSLYGSSLRTSNEQGGAWFIRTNGGRIDGFLVPSTSKAPGPKSRILTIEVGDVGCPAMSP